MWQVRETWRIDPSALGQSFWTLLRWAMTVSMALAHCTSEVAKSPGGPRAPSCVHEKDKCGHTMTRNHLLFSLTSHPKPTHWQILAFSLKWILNLPLLHVLWPSYWSRSQPSLNPRRRALPNWTGTALSLLGTPVVHHLMGLSQTFSHPDMSGMAVFKSPMVTLQMAQARVMVWGPTGARACSWPEVWGRLFWSSFYCTRLVPSPSVRIREAPITDTVMPYSAHMGLCVYMHMHVCVYRCMYTWLLGVCLPHWNVFCSAISALGPTKRLITWKKLNQYL